MSSWLAARDGFRDGLPLGVTYAVLGCSIGHFGTRVLGFPPEYVATQSVLLFAGQSQIGALKLLHDGGSGVAALLLVLFINARFSLMAASLAVHLNGRSLPGLLVGAFFLGNGTFALAMRRFAVHGGQLGYYLCLGLSAFVGYAGGSVAGATLGNALPPALEGPASYVLPAFITSMLVTGVLATRWPMITLAVLNGLLTLAIAAWYGPNLALVGGPVLAATIMTLIKHRRSR